MREYGVEINFKCLEAQTLAKKRFSFTVFFIAHSHCLATIAFILDIYLWWHVLWRLKSQLCGALRFWSVISLYLAGE